MSAPPTIATVKELGRKYSNWGRWGKDDELGTLNHATPAGILRAAGLIRTGRVVEMGLPIDETGPQSGGGAFGRFNPIHLMIRDGADVVAGTTIRDFYGGVDRYLRGNLCFGREEFDAVMFWDLADFLPEPLVKPLIERIHAAMKPGGILLAFFHTKDAGPEAPFYRYNIATRDTLELQQVRGFKLQRVFNNRHVENLFHDYGSIKFFLGRDNIREVLVTR